MTELLFQSSSEEYCWEEPIKLLRKQTQNKRVLALPDIKIHFKTIVMKSGASVRIVQNGIEKLVVCLGLYD